MVQLKSRCWVHHGRVFSVETILLLDPLFGAHSNRHSDEHYKEDDDGKDHELKDRRSPVMAWVLRVCGSSTAAEDVPDTKTTDMSVSPTASECAMDEPLSQDGGPVRAARKVLGPSGGGSAPGKRTGQGDWPIKGWLGSPKNKTLKYRNRENYKISPTSGIHSISFVGGSGTEKREHGEH